MGGRADRDTKRDRDRQTDKKRRRIMMTTTTTKRSRTKRGAKKRTKRKKERKLLCSAILGFRLGPWAPSKDSRCLRSGSSTMQVSCLNDVIKRARREPRSQ